MRTVQESDETIDGVRFRVAPMGGYKGLRMQARLGKIIGPALNTIRLLSQGSTGGAALVAIVAGIAENLDPNEVESICKEFAQDTKVEKQPGTGQFVLLSDVFDLFFTGRFDLLWKWVALVLKVNFGPLLNALPIKPASDGASTNAG